MSVKEVSLYFLGGDQIPLIVLLGCRPSLVTLPPESKIRTKNGEPLLLVFDSLGDKSTISHIKLKNILGKIRRYLSSTWNDQESQDFCGAQHEFSEIEVPTVIISAKPEQDNTWDCGCYLLQYMEKMFER